MFNQSTLRLYDISQSYPPPRRSALYSKSVAKRVDPRFPGLFTLVYPPGHSRDTFQPRSGWRRRESERKKKKKEKAKGTLARRKPIQPRVELSPSSSFSSSFFFSSSRRRVRSRVGGRRRVGTYWPSHYSSIKTSTRYQSGVCTSATEAGEWRFFEFLRTPRDSRLRAPGAREDRDKGGRRLVGA